jgi:hypothetical protein
MSWDDLDALESTLRLALQGASCSRGPTTGRARAMDVHHLAPRGRDLKFSLNDNRLIVCNSQKLHYPSPTEGL